MGEFEYGPYWIYSVRVISNASFDEIIKFYPIVSKLSTCAARDLGRYGSEYGAN